MKNLISLLKGGDLRSIAGADKLVKSVKKQQQFDALMEILQSNDRLQVMRSADAIEKISVYHPEYLTRHKKILLNLMDTAVNKELKWHLALIISRLPLNRQELTKVWTRLWIWATDKGESRIVRVNALQALTELRKQTGQVEQLQKLLGRLTKENIPSLSARIKKVEKMLTAQLV